jgi:hypothetical protein
MPANGVDGYRLYKKRVGFLHAKRAIVSLIQIGKMISTDITIEIRSFIVSVVLPLVAQFSQFVCLVLLVDCKP